MRPGRHLNVWVDNPDRNPSSHRWSADDVSVDDVSVGDVSVDDGWGSPSQQDHGRQPSRSSRRRFLTRVFGAFAAPAGFAAMGSLASCSNPPSLGGSGSQATPTSTVNTDGAGSSASRFLHGVASGDPGPDRVILWTRVTPPDLNAQPSTAQPSTVQPSAVQPVTVQPVTVDWMVATDDSFAELVASGTVITGPERDFTINVDALGLTPGKQYYYRFASGTATSSVGRTKTLPTGSIDHLRLGVASCANYPGGYFHAYRLLAEREDLDVVLHLGDYLYEYQNHYFGDGEPLGRVPDPDHELISLEDYRRRHRQYKQDPDLQAVHSQHGFITIWDDHEIANDAHRDGAQNHQLESEGTYADRRSAAVQAYLEWMPIRQPASSAAADATSSNAASSNAASSNAASSENEVTDHQIYRSFDFGDLLQLTMLDARLVGRDAQIAHPCDVPAAMSDERSMLGQEQEAWLFGELRRFNESAARWCVLGQQVMLGQLSNASTTCIADPDQWDGYGASRGRLLDLIESEAIENIVVLTGDAHSSWAMDIAKDPFDGQTYDPESGEGSLAVEFVVPGISSAGPGGDTTQLANSHPHVRYAELTRQGYVVLDVTRDRAQAQWHYVADVRASIVSEFDGPALATTNGSNRVSPV